MPVDGVLVQLNSSGSSAELRAEANEFVPRHFENGTRADQTNNNDSRRRKKPTGTVPKKFSNPSSSQDNNSRRNVRNGRPDPQPPRFQQGNERREAHQNDDGPPPSDNRPFFKDNQSYQNGRNRGSHNYDGNYTNGNSKNSRNQQWDRNEFYDEMPVDRRQERRPERRDNRFEQRNGSSQDFRRDDRPDRRENRYDPKNEASQDFRRDDFRKDDRPEVKRDNRRQREDRWDDRPRRNGAKDNQQGYSQKKPQQTPVKLKKENSIEPSMISQREQLTKDIENNNLECMICCDKIRDHQSIWNCSNCYRIQHLNCIRTWINNSKTESGEWRCVACQYLRLEAPKDYICFCGKQKYPAVNRNDLAHSCGEMCGRADNCVHPCQLLCHPGPHAVCQASIQRSCGCGKSWKTFQCSMKETFECEESCEKLLTCGVHKCSEPCHQGECSPCAATIEMKCYCEKESKVELCTPETALITKYSCEKECDKLLSCQNHHCKQKCHSESCASCALAPERVRACPCGRTDIAVGDRKNCNDPIPLCKAVCGKALKCGPLAAPHACTKTCHLGDCPPCSKSTNVKCRCGRIEEKIACKDLLSTDVRCKKKCTKFRSCGKHKCNQSCCIELEHICTNVCGRQLECKKHKCQKPCHIGNCLPCPRVSFDELRCECGTAVVYPPVPCGTRVPECKNPCRRPHKCSHPVKHLCHSESDCTPCVFLTTKYCYGKHEQRKTIPCSEDSFSCGMPCGKGLKCLRHKCIKKCHLLACESAADVCKQPCTVKKDCGHNCNFPCHEGSCPDRACREQIEVSCACGNLKEMKSCEYVANENRKLQRAKLAMQMQDGEQVEIKDIYGEPSKSTTKILECNYDCATLERNRRLDIAFKVENPNLISYPKFTPNYTEFIRGFYKKEPAFVKMVHDKLTDLVKLAKESKQKSRSHSFPTMNRDKRHAVHDLAAMFGVETQAYDAEPNRNVVATASKESCWLPSVSIMEVMQREAGQRQVRPPSLDKTPATNVSLPSAWK